MLSMFGNVLNTTSIIPFKILLNYMGRNEYIPYEKLMYRDMKKLAESHIRS